MDRVTGLRYGSPSVRATELVEEARAAGRGGTRVARPDGGTARALVTVDTARPTWTRALDPPRRSFIAPEDVQAPTTRRRRLVALWVAIALCVVAISGVLFDRTATAGHQRATAAELSTVERHVASATTQLALISLSLAQSKAAVGSDTSTLAQDANALQGAQRTLAGAQATVTQLSSLIGALHSCLGGVERALNALAVDSVGTAVSALNSVSSSCSAAAADV